MAKKRQTGGWRPTPSRLVEGVEHARRLMEQHRWMEAREVLEALRERYPPNQAVLGDLSNVCVALDDNAGCLGAIEGLVELRPDDPDVAANLAVAYMKDDRYALALVAFRDLLDRWPTHARARDARLSIPVLETAVEPMLVDLGLEGEGGLDACTLHEMSQRLLARGEYAEARDVAEELLELRPGYEPALNNISLSWLVEGRLDKAIEAGRRVLAADPDNVHALANMVRYLVRSGAIEEARAIAGRLRRVDRPATDVYLKKAEAFTFLGDDEAVLEALAAADKADELAYRPEGEAHLLHFAAVAAARLGREAEARGYWRRARDLAPDFEPSGANLDDLELPVGERHAPWPFLLNEWIAREAIDRLVERFKSTSRRGERGPQEALRTYLGSEPGVAALVPVLLDRGDPTGREFALRLAMGAETPEMQAALKDFALSQRGPDAMRMQAAKAALDAGLIAPGPVRFWAQGAWEEVMMLGFQLHGEPDGRHSRDVERLAREAAEALFDDNGLEAERVLSLALAREPGAVDLRYNLSNAFALQGRVEEAEALVRQIHEEHPEYLFARTTLAGLALEDGHVEEARSLLEPLLSKRSMHYGEFVALAGAWILVCEAEGKPEGARSWLEMMQRVLPDHPATARWEQRLAPKRGRKR